jgi:guanylate kinase
MAELERRLRGRGTDSDEVIARRLSAACDEIAHYGVFDYLVVNDEIEQAYSEVRAIVLAERARRSRRAPMAEELIRTGCADRRAGL